MFNYIKFCTGKSSLAAEACFGAFFDKDAVTIAAFHEICTAECVPSLWVTQCPAAAVTGHAVYAVINDDDFGIILQDVLFYRCVHWAFIACDNLFNLV